MSAYAMDRRYFDADVRANPDLLELAIDYVWDYPGDFEPLVTARELVRLTDSLPVPTARMVLNCMRGDPHVAASLPPPPRLTVVRDLPARPPVPPRHQRPVNTAKPKPSFIDVPVVIKANYGISVHRGYKLHVVASATCTYSKNKGLNGKPSGHQQFPWAHFEVKWMCHAMRGAHNWTEWPRLFIAPPPDSDHCRACWEYVESFEGSILLARQEVLG